MNVNRLLRLEGLVLFVSAIVLYAISGGSGLLFVVLLLTPDLAMLGYRVNARVGAAVYNSVHTYLLPGILFAVGYVFSAPLAMQIALIWFAHIGMDRMMGYGLKYPTEFKDTHMQHV
ncbi:MAG: DUF4260 domain-containing protein [Chloroflexota bacterium]